MPSPHEKRPPLHLTQTNQGFEVRHPINPTLKFGKPYLCIPHITPIYPPLKQPYFCETLNVSRELYGACMPKLQVHVALDIPAQQWFKKETSGNGKHYSGLQGLGLRMISRERGTKLWKDMANDPELLDVVAKPSSSPRHRWPPEYNELRNRQRHLIEVFDLGFPHPHAQQLHLANGRLGGTP